MADQMHPDEAAFHRALDEDPHDWDTRLVFSDWLEENGKQDEAQAQRWMGVFKKAPRPGWAATPEEANRHWWWGSDAHHVHEGSPLQPHHLPRVVSNHVWGYAGDEHTTRRGQELELAHGLKALRNKGIDPFNWDSLQ